MKELLRKTMVSLKRSPQTIPLIGLIVAFVYYSFNLTKISDTTAKLQGKNMGLCGFITMLFSILVFVCFLNAFPKRQKVNAAMLVLSYFMFACMIVCDIWYRNRIAYSRSREDFANVFATSDYIDKADHVVLVHIILVVIVAVLIALLPVYGRLLKKINTSVEVETNENMQTIDIEEE